MTKKINQSSIIEPTDEELSLYQNLIKDLNEEQMDEFTDAYFELVEKEKIEISFPRFIINKVVRPIKPGDTISFEDVSGNVKYLFCTIRKVIEETTYLIFAMVNDDETINTEEVYLFFVDGTDEIGMEIIDIVQSSPEAERILNLIEENDDAEIHNEVIEKEEKE